MSVSARSRKLPKRVIQYVCNEPDKFFREKYFTNINHDQQEI